MLTAGGGGEGEWGSSVSWFRPATSLVQLIPGRNLKEADSELDNYKNTWKFGSTVSCILGRLDRPGSSLAVLQ